VRAPQADSVERAPAALAQATRREEDSIAGLAELVESTAVEHTGKPI